MEDLPAIWTEFAEGRLSFDHVKFACRLATPETNGQWAMEARKHSASDALVQLASQSLGSDADPDRATVVVHVSAEALITRAG